MTFMLEEHLFAITIPLQASQPQVSMVNIIYFQSFMRAKSLADLEQQYTNT